MRMIKKKDIPNMLAQRMNVVIPSAGYAISSPSQITRKLVKWLIWCITSSFKELIHFELLGILRKWENLISSAVLKGYLSLETQPIPLTYLSLCSLLPRYDITPHPFTMQKLRSPILNTKSS